MKVCFFFSVCILLVGCGLFNRIKHSKQQLEETQLSNESRLLKVAQAKTTDRSTRQLESRTNQQEQLKWYLRAGSAVLIQPDGSISLEADSLFASRTGSQHLSLDQRQDVLSTFALQVDSLAVTDSLSRMESQQKQMVSKASFWGIPGNGLLALLFVGVLGWGLYRYWKR